MTTAKKQAELIREITGVNPYKCMKCGKCSASCPSYNEMDIKPHQFAGTDGIQIFVEVPLLLRLRGALPTGRKARQAHRRRTAAGHPPERPRVPVS